MKTAKEFTEKLKELQKTHSDNVVKAHKEYVDKVVEEAFGSLQYDVNPYIKIERKNYDADMLIAIGKEQGFRVSTSNEKEVIYFSF